MYKNLWKYLVRFDKIMEVIKKIDNKSEEITWNYGWNKLSLKTKCNIIS